MCSILYELLLAQTLTTVMGNTVLRYHTTIGLYIASMGLGAILFNRLSQKNLCKHLVIVELALSLLGTVSPILVICGNSLFSQIAHSLGISPHSTLINTSNFIYNHSFICAIGILSGFELPLLMAMGGQQSNRILVYDYVGTFVGATAFPLLLLPQLGIFTTAHIVGLLNVFCAAILLCHYKEARQQAIPGIATLATLITIFVYRHPIAQYLIDNIYL